MEGEPLAPPFLRLLAIFPPFPPLADQILQLRSCGILGPRLSCPLDAFRSPPPPPSVNFNFESFGDPFTMSSYLGGGDMNNPGIITKTWETAKV